VPPFASQVSLLKIGTPKIFQTGPLDTQKLTLFFPPITVDFVADGVTGDAEFYSDDDDAELPAPPRSPQAARPPPQAQTPTPQNDLQSPDSSEEVSHNTSRSTATSATTPRVPLTNGRRQSTRLATRATQQTQQPSPPSPTGQHAYAIPPRSLPQTTSHHHHRSMSDDLPLSPTDRFIVQDELIPPIHPPLTLTAEDLAAHPNIYTENSVFPLQDKRQAVLLRHFVQNLAIWVCKRSRHQDEGNFVADTSCSLTFANPRSSSAPSFPSAQQRVLCS
jgi:hypothetical protein